ncbi:MAG: GAF domain-containing sensor histidine kinase [Chloroflexi bacterium]|nr:GAF domain-containing sensor histidine kinase [Chloroflexota bacterium]
MSKNRLRWITVILPAIFLISVLGIAGVLFDSGHTIAEYVFSGVVITIGAIGFSLWVFRYVNQREHEIQLRAAQLESLNAASLALTTELEIGVVLQKVVDLSRQLVKSRYGALGVLSEDEEYFEQFVSSGIPEEQLRYLKQPPGNRGIFRLLIKGGSSIRVNDINNHEEAVGFPSNHPEMTTLLGVPIISKGKVIGALYLADKISNDHPSRAMEFDANDQRILEMFATQAAIAIENAKLYRLSQDLVLLSERERFGMDLHDGIIQSIYAVGLMLEDVQRNVVNDPEKSSDRISEAVNGLNDVINDLRNYIMDLRPQRFQGKNLVEGLEELAKELRANTLINVIVNAGGYSSQWISPDQTVEILHVAQEALTNVRKHARATSVEIWLRTEDSLTTLSIKDNGRSFSHSEQNQSKGNGLHNMRERANLLNGEVKIEPRAEGGTKVHLTVPHDIETNP